MAIRDVKRGSSSENVVRRRWERLSDSARALLVAFLVHPEPLKPAWLSRLATNSRDVDVLTESGWIKETEFNEWILADQRVEPLLRKLAPWSLRQSQHRALSALCREEQPQVAAFHLETVGDAEAARAWIQAAAQAHVKEPARLGECLEAAQRLMRGNVDPAQWDELVHVLEHCSGDLKVAELLTSRLTVWLKDARQRSHHAFVGRLGPLLASLLATQGEHVSGAEWRTHAAFALEALNERAPAARQLAAASLTYAFALQYSAARETAIAAVAMAEVAGDTATRVEALSYAGLLFGMKGDTAVGRTYLERALDLALRQRLTSAAAEAYRMLGTVAEYASCYGDEQAAFAKALAYCRRHDEKTTADLCLGCLSYSLFRSGNWVRSRAIINQVLSRQNAPAVSRLVAEGVMGLLLAHRGELRDAAPLLEATISGARQTGIFGMEFFGLWGLALVEEQSGQHAAAALHYRNLIRFWRSTEDRHDAIPGLTCGGLFFADRGDSETAAEFGSALDQIARETANPEAIGAAAVVAGGLHACGRNWRSAEKSFARALVAFEKRDLVLERIRVLTRLASVQRALGNHAKADQAAKEAGKRARRLGARALFTTVESTATVANGKPDSWGGLSPRQRDVARHLTAGKTNKEIAAHLGVSVRTIDMHVAHVLKRLDCRTRSEAAGRISVLLE